MKTNNENNKIVIEEGQIWVHQFHNNSKELKTLFVSYIDEEKELVTMKKYEKGVAGVAGETTMKISTAIKLISERHPIYKNQSKFFYKKVYFPAFEADDKYIIDFYNKLKKSGGDEWNY